MSYKQLHRSINNRRIAGVAAGIAEYFNIDPTPVRLIWLLAIFVGGTGFLAYVIAWIVIPEAPYASNEASQTPINITPTEQTEATESDDKRRLRLTYAGIFLILLGGIFLLREFLPWQLSRFSWALFLIALGVFMLLPRKRRPRS